MEIEQVNKWIDYHKKMKLPFTLTISNYTTKIKSSLCDLHFMKTEQSNQTFAAYAKIKSDCKKMPLPEINKLELKYYSQNLRQGDFYADQIFNFDLKAAYASILYVDGFISLETFTYLKRLPKMQRLAAVGMLAGKKEVYEINEDGKPETRKTVISETANYFFYCVLRTYEIINGAASILKECFLFSWVDGIYFCTMNDRLKEDLKKELEIYFEEKKMAVSFEILHDFEIKEKPQYYTALYKKEGIKKYIVVPKTDNTTVNKLTDYLLNKNY